MNRQQIQADLERWLVEFVESENPKLNNWSPCPYARAARLSGLIQVEFVEVGDLTAGVTNALPQLDAKDVVVVCFDHNMIDPVELQEWVSAINNDLMPRNYVVLEDHPHSPEFVNGVKMNFGGCGLLIVQKLDKLNTAADRLRQKGYYDHWDRRSLDSVVAWRYSNEVLQN